MAQSNEISNFFINKYQTISDRYELLEQIDRGAFGDVMLAKDVLTNKKKAVKIMRLMDNDGDANVDNTYIEKLVNEAKLMSRLDHPNILKFDECFQYNIYFCIVSEYCEESLTKVLQRHIRETSRPSNQFIYEWLYKLSQGLNYLHDQKVIHRDIKPSNILFKSNEIKFADFGESKDIMQTINKTTAQHGTLYYMPPEVLEDEKHTYKSDICDCELRSLGCVFHEINYLELAFDGNDPRELKINIKNRKMKNFVKDKSKINDLIDRMIWIDQSVRFSIKDVLSHEYFGKNKQDEGSNTNKLSYVNDSVMNYLSVPSTLDSVTPSSAIVDKLKRVSTNNSAYYISENAFRDIKQATSPTTTSTHRFEFVSFETMERCEYCCGILYGVCRQAVKCKEKSCNYLCHTKCRSYIPENCPISINQRIQLKGVDFYKGIGTLMQGCLKIPKPGGIKKGWVDHYAFLSNARLFICPIQDSRPGLIPVQVIDIRDPNFDVRDVNENDVIYANKRDIPCIFRIIVTKLKYPEIRQLILFCAKDYNDKQSWIGNLKELNKRLIDLSKQSSNSTSIVLPIEAKQICDATTKRNALSAFIYDSERLLIASEDGIDLIDINFDCTIRRIHDKKTYMIDVCREEKLIIAISGKSHQICIFPTIVIEGINAGIVKVEETKGCHLFCIGKITHNLQLSSQTFYLCVAIKKVILIYKILSDPKPKYYRLREIECFMNVQSLQIVNNKLCVGCQSEFCLYSLASEDAPISLLNIDHDKSLDFIYTNPVNGLMCAQVNSDEYLLVFESLGIYVNTQGQRSRREEIMWPSKPLYVSYIEPYILSFSERGIDVFHSHTGEWIQILQFSKTKPLDRNGSICLCNELQDSIRILQLKAT